MNNAVWSCGSSLTCKIWATALLHFLPWSDKTGENPYNWTKKRKNWKSEFLLNFRSWSFYPHFIFSNFNLTLFIWYLTILSKIIQSFNPYFFLILIPWTTEIEELKWQFEPTIISANSSTLIFWVWINHPVPTIDIWSFHHSSPSLTLSYYSSFS